MHVRAWLSDVTKSIILLELYSFSITDLPMRLAVNLRSIRVVGTIVVSSNKSSKVIVDGRDCMIVSYNTIILRITSLLLLWMDYVIVSYNKISELYVV